MNGFVRAGRDSDTDLIMLFGNLSTFITDVRRQVREMVVLPTMSGPGNDTHTKRNYIYGL